MGDGFRSRSADVSKAGDRIDELGEGKECYAKGEGEK